MQKTLKRYFPIFVVPTLIAFAFAFIIPFIEGVYLSFCKFTTVGNAHWVGLENYKAALTSQDFTYSFWVTAAFTVISVITVNVFAFCIALLLTRKLRGTNFFMDGVLPSELNWWYRSWIYMAADDQCRIV